MIPMWQHQERAVKFAESLPDLALFYDMGTGKSRTTIEILRRKYARHGHILKTLIFAPPVVCQNWKDEFLKFSKIKSDDIVVLTGPGKKRQSRFQLDVQGRNRIVVTNYETVQMKALWEEIQEWSPQILVCDESQRLKNPESMRARKVVAVADKTMHNYILTGTPILNSPMDIFMQFRVLDRGGTFGRNFFAFRAGYFYDANARWKGKQNYFPQWECSPEAYDRLQGLTSSKALRVTKAECLDLPPFVRMAPHEVELSKEQAKAYQEMMNEYVTFIEDKSGEPKAVVAQLAVTKALRLQQIVSGFVRDENGVDHRLPCPRLDALGDLLTELCPTHKVIVWCVFKENYAMIGELCEKLKIKNVSLTGDQNTKEKQQAMDQFRNDPDVRVIVANQSAGGVGVNLIEASYAIYYSKGFKLEDDLQSEARNYRGGSEIHEKVTRIDLMAKGTIDELVTEALANKQQIGERILGWTERLKSQE